MLASYHVHACMHKLSLLHNVISAASSVDQGSSESHCVGEGASLITIFPQSDAALM